jgi:hypothetical protein
MLQLIPKEITKWEEVKEKKLKMLKHKNESKRDE